MRLRMLTLFFLAGPLALAAQDMASVNAFKLPFRPGEEFIVIQGNRGAFSHHDEGNLFAWDFAMPEGTVVTAAGPGRVVECQDTLTATSDMPDQSKEANYVMIDHGGGRFSRYLHLQAGSIPVHPGEMVSTGQFIGRAGRTGMATRPHLHFTLVNFRGVSVPSRFLDWKGNEGVPERGDSCKSVWAGGALRFSGDSLLPLEEFAGNGVILEAGVPSRFLEEGRAYFFKGKVLPGASSVVCILRNRERQDLFQESRAAVGRDGTFEISIRPGEIREGGIKRPEMREWTFVALTNDGKRLDGIYLPVTVARNGAGVAGWFARIWNSLKR